MSAEPEGPAPVAIGAPAVASLDPVSTAEDRRALLVVGMHRSGTSATARFLSLLGADLPRRLMAPHPRDNPLGFWESDDVLELHEEILAAEGSAWDDVSPLRDGWSSAERARAFEERLVALLEADFADSRCFVVKDPRLSRLVPLWLGALRRLAVRPHFVLPYRHPLEVAASLRVRGAVPREKSLLLWLWNVLEAERGSRGHPRCLFSFEDLLSDWRRVAEDLSRKLGLLRNPLGEGVSLEIEAFLSERHRHHRYSEESARTEIDVGWVAEVFAALRRLSTEEEPSVHRELDRIRVELVRADRAYGPVLAESRRATRFAREEAERLEGEAARTAEASSASGRTQPFSFLISSERSGSNLLARLVGAHPEICSPSPCQLLRFLGTGFRYGDTTHEPDAWAELTQDAERLLATRHGVWRRSPMLRELRDAASERSVGALVAGIYRLEAESHGKARIFVKENKTHEYFGLLEATFPGAKYVYLVRDPRDVALSWKSTPGLRGGVLRATREWLSDQRGFASLLGWLTPGRRVLGVRYETLLRDPEEILRHVCDFLGVSYSVSMLSFHEDPLNRTGAARVSAWSNLAKPVLSDNAGKFRAGLEREEIRYVEAACRSEMERLGYRPEIDDGTGDPEVLGQGLVAGEPHEKPDYGRLPAVERRALADFRATLETIRRRRARWPLL